MSTILWVAFGGGIGAVCRFLLYNAIQTPTTGFPYGTLAVNLAGCLCIGLVYALMEGNSNLWLKPFLIVGVLGGFTTFSTFGLESFQLIRNNEWMHAIVYILLSNVLGFVLVFSGMYFVALLSGKPS